MNDIRNLFQPPAINETDLATLWDAWNTVAPTDAQVGLDKGKERGEPWAQTLYPPSIRQSIWFIGYQWNYRMEPLTSQAFQLAFPTPIGNPVEIDVARYYTLRVAPPSFYHSWGDYLRGIRKPGEIPDEIQADRKIKNAILKLSQQQLVSRNTLLDSLSIDSLEVSPEYSQHVRDHRTETRD